MSEKNGDNDNENAPTPLIEDNNNDDDEPPTAGAVMIEVMESNTGLKVSLAPTAEPAHRVRPTTVTV